MGGRPASAPGKRGYSGVLSSVLRVKDAWNASSSRATTARRTGRWSTASSATGKVTRMSCTSASR